jgi:glyoxylase-like metal-dependent hydrolase (beta-lactamase superfamily II)
MSHAPATPGQVQTLATDLRMILAPNPAPMTGPGTNTYLLGTGDLALIDPGPDDPRHLDAILAALCPGERITHIFVTHAHLDHSALAPALSRATGAPVLAYGDATAGRSARMAALAAAGGLSGGEGVDTTFRPDRRLADGETLQRDGWCLTAIHTPGHFGNHLTFVSGDRAFTGDHVMGWSTSLISPPDGDMGAYMSSLARLAALPIASGFPGHGAPIPDLPARIAELACHRRLREDAVLEALARAPADAETLARSIYTDTPATLLPAATRNVLAHLIDLAHRNLVLTDTPLTRASRFQRA